MPIDIDLDTDARFGLVKLIRPVIVIKLLMWRGARTRRSFSGSG